MDELRARAIARSKDKGQIGWEKTSIHLPGRFMGLINKAAKRRGIGRAAYIRRALAVIVARDLDMQWRDIIRECPVALPYGQRKYSKDAPSTMRDTGDGYGDWDIS